MGHAVIMRSLTLGAMTCPIASWIAIFVDTTLDDPELEHLDCPVGRELSQGPEANWGIKLVQLIGLVFYLGTEYVKKGWQRVSLIHWMQIAHMCTVHNDFDPH
jgi:hypothetical protein